MIQRKQTLYLIAVVILMSLTFVFPSSVGVINNTEYVNIYKIMPFGVYGSAADSADQPTLFSTTYMGGAICFTLAWTVLVIATFKNYWSQMRLTVFLMIWLVCVEVFMVINGYKLVGELDNISAIKNGFPMNWGAVMPIVSLFFAYMAFRSSLADALLIKSLNSKRMR